MLILITACTSCALKYDNENDFKVSPLNGGKQTEITGYAGTKKIIVIPPSIQGKPVTRIGDDAFKRREIIGVIIPNSVNAIGAGAFSYNPLTSITIPESVTEIGEAAFAFCERLDISVTIPSGVTSIGKNAFAYCINLPSITIPSGVTALGEMAFNDWDAMQNINIMGFDCQTAADNAWQTSWRSGCNAKINYLGLQE